MAGEMLRKETIDEGSHEKLCYSFYLGNFFNYLHLLGGEGSEAL